MDEERRKGSPRQRIRKTGSIRFLSNNGLHPNGVVDCCVTNLSPVGARLQVASQIGIPNDFVLVTDFDDVEVPCRVIWRTDTLLGVEYKAKPRERPLGASVTSASADLLPPPSTPAGPLVRSQHSGTPKPRWKMWASKITSKFAEL